MTVVNNTSRLAVIGREVEAKIKALDKYSGKADDMAVSVEQLLVEAKGLCEPQRKHRRHGKRKPARRSAVRKSMCSARLLPARHNRGTTGSHP